MGTPRFLLLRLTNAAANSARLFSSSTALIRMPWTHLTEEPEDSNGKSVVYKRALKLQRPTAVRYFECVRNSVSLIGSIERPLEVINANGTKFGVYTRLKIKTQIAASGHFWVSLKFWDEMAELSLQHLKPNDMIYVSGRLGSQIKVAEDGKSMHSYEVHVTEINFVAQNGPAPASGNLVKLEPRVSVEDLMQKRRARLHLWSIFFASPYEWWDNRNTKLKPNHPDFKHKDTGEALWLRPNDPPWIKQQLDLLDSRSLNKQRPGKYRNSYSQLSPLVYDDAEGT